jgi:hypothetical protein
LGGAEQAAEQTPGFSFQAAHGTGVHDERGKIIIACEDRVYSAMYGFFLRCHGVFRSDQKQGNAWQDKLEFFGGFKTALWITCHLQDHDIRVGSMAFLRGEGNM